MVVANDKQVLLVDRGNDFSPLDVNPSHFSRRAHVRAPHRKAVCFILSSLCFSAKSDIVASVAMTSALPLPPHARPPTQT
jgi:hypothetical protein